MKLSFYAAVLFAANWLLIMMKEYVSSAKNRKEEHQGAYDRENERKLSELLEISAVTGRSCRSDLIDFANFSMSVITKPRYVYCKSQSSNWISEKGSMGR